LDDAFEFRGVVRAVRVLRDDEEREIAVVRLFVRRDVHAVAGLEIRGLNGLAAAADDGARIEREGEVAVMMIDERELRGADRLHDSFEIEMSGRGRAARPSVRGRAAGAQLDDDGTRSRVPGVCRLDAVGAAED